MKSCILLVPIPIALAACASSPPPPPASPQVAVVDVSPPPPATSSPKPQDQVAQPTDQEFTQEAGMIGLLTENPSPNADASADPLSSQGNMWGDSIGDSDSGSGSAAPSNPPSVTSSATHVSGRLPPVVIQKIVRQNFARLRLCYENGLRKNPTLQGKIAVRFIIGINGNVSTVASAGSDLTDNNVVSCVLRTFMTLTFPKPEGGIVAVTYPIAFSPGDSQQSTAKGQK